MYWTERQMFTMQSPGLGGTRSTYDHILVHLCMEAEKMNLFPIHSGDKTVRFPTASGCVCTFLFIRFQDLLTFVYGAEKSLGLKPGIIFDG